MLLHKLPDTRSLGTCQDDSRVCTKSVVPPTTQPIMQAIATDETDNVAEKLTLAERNRIKFFMVNKTFEVVEPTNPPNPNFWALRFLKTLYMDAVL
ncbi:hypothetical protein Peur_046720 [Populus x canadensis]